MHRVCSISMVIQESIVSVQDAFKSHTRVVEGNGHHDAGSLHQDPG